jgi:hypothetical protein
MQGTQGTSGCVTRLFLPPHCAEAVHRSSRTGSSSVMYVLAREDTVDTTADVLRQAYVARTVRRAARLHGLAVECQRWAAPQQWRWEANLRAGVARDGQVQGEAAALRGAPRPWLPRKREIYGAPQGRDCHLGAEQRRPRLRVHCHAAPGALDRADPEKELRDDAGRGGRPRVAPRMTVNQSSVPVSRQKFAGWGAGYGHGRCRMSAQACASRSAQAECRWQHQCSIAIVALCLIISSHDRWPSARMTNRTKDVSQA